jgi:diguanylate cyclase (GGDEF)-like protein
VNTSRSAVPKVLLLGAAAARPEGLERALARAGFAVREADAPPRASAGGAEAPYEPDLVLIALAAAGPELERLLARRVSGGTRAPRIVLLAEGGAAALEHALAAGADDALVGAPDASGLTDLVARLRGRLAATAAQPAAPAPAIDPLTGCGTLPAFEQRLAEEFERARRYALGFSLARLEIDELRTVNGRAGAEAGDRLLAEVGAELRREVRGPDLVARCGGDGFAILFPETGAAGARAALARIRARLDACRPAALTEPVAAGGLRVSAGIVSVPHPGVDTASALLPLAEAALRRGRAASEERVATAV